MPLPDLGDLQRGMAIAGTDLSQVLSRHAVQSIQRFGVVARADEQLVKWRPVVAPIQIEANALAQSRFVNLPPPPLVKNVLVASKYGFDSENHRTIACQSSLLN